MLKNGSKDVINKALVYSKSVTMKVECELRFSRTNVNMVHHTLKKKKTFGNAPSLRLHCGEDKPALRHRRNFTGSLLWCCH